MRYSIDLDNEIIKMVDKEAVQEHRTRKLQMETIIIQHLSTTRQSQKHDALSKITKSNNIDKLLTKL